MSNQSSLPLVDCCRPVTTHALSNAHAQQVARAFKALGDPIRLQLFSMIAGTDDEICVCDLTCAFDVSAPTISHHLKVLRTAGLVSSERRGTWVYYRIEPDAADALSLLLRTKVPA